VTEVYFATATYGVFALLIVIRAVFASSHLACPLSHLEFVLLLSLISGAA